MPRRPSIYEELADLYLRLNGYFTVKNFIQHPQLAQTDIDVLAVRSKYEKEFVGEKFDVPLKNDPKIVDSSDPHPVDIVIAEIKGNGEWFNETWLCREHVLPYALLRVGFTPSKEEIGRVAERLRREGRAESDNRKFGMRLVLFSDYSGPPKDFGVHLTWDDVLAFLKSRLELTVSTQRRSAVKAYEPGLKDPLFERLRRAYPEGTLDRELIRRLCPKHEYEERKAR